MPSRDPDEGLVVVFKYIPMQNPQKTLEQGRPVFDDVEVCEIRSPGSKDIKHQPSTAFARWTDDWQTGEQCKQSYAERFSHQYRQFKASAAQTVSGTPLYHAPFLTEARRAELRAQNVYTVEALAAIEGSELKNLGPGGRDMKNRAAEYIEQSKSNAPNLQLQAELEALRARNAVLEEDIIIIKSNRAKAEAEFEGMTTEAIREYIASRTGHAPQGSMTRKSLIRLAMEIEPEKAA